MEAVAKRPRMTIRAANRVIVLGMDGLDPHILEAGQPQLAVQVMEI
jgi:hypothetical protein